MNVARRTLQIASVILALAAAMIGAAIALDGSTEKLFQAVSSRNGMDVFGSDFDVLLQSLIADGKRNALAATCAALAALLQGIAIVFEWKENH